MTKIRTVDGDGVYLDCDDLSTCGCRDGIHPGTHKHTDEPMTVRWDDDADGWVEVPLPVPAQWNPVTETWNIPTGPVLPPARSRTQTKRLTRSQRKKRR